MKTPLVAKFALVASFALVAGPAAAEETSLHNTEIYVSPWAGETPSKGTFSVRHEGIGELPETGYFKEHEPGEVAEFHLFVPDGLDATKRYPLLIVYHGGKDGGSGKGMCGNFAKLSTTEHPVIVLSPNMYTLDAMNELLAEGKLPIDRHRVVVYGHSSGGMGVHAAMREFIRTGGEFTPAALLSASTTASLGKADYPPCPYYVIAGEKETPAFVTNEILRERRRTCRIHALTMQQVFADVRYVEIKDSGHSGGTPAHKAIIQHALAVSERAPVTLSVRAAEPAVEPLVAAASSGDWRTVREELTRLGETLPAQTRSALFASLQEWLDGEVKAIAAVTPDSDYVTRDRAFVRFDRCQSVAELFADTSIGAALAASLAKLADAKHWQAELAARESYREIVKERPGAALKTKLAELRAAAPTTEYGRNRTREKLLALEEVQAPPDPAESPEGPAIVNPYYTNATWRVWRDDATPVENVTTVVRDGKEKKAATITLEPTPPAARIYPAGPLEDGEPVKWTTSAEPSDRFAGVWDDVYASWSGLHGYVRPTWHATDGSAVHLRPKSGDQIMHFVEARKTADLLRCGINFVHQSTTGMAHTITNGYGLQMTESYEKIYFSDCLVTAPAHASFTEEWADRTKDLYLALVPTLFNSVGSSNSETLAITKMMVVGGYLPPESKRKLKQSGLYPAALLYLWKAALPYDVPYDHELRHRIAYRSLGNDAQFPGKYGHAGSERGNLALDFHCYDEIAHTRAMIGMAQAMTVLPPEAIFADVEVEGGKEVYALKKTALVLQEPGQDVTIKLSTAASYDLQERPVSVRWKLLYGTRSTTCEPGEEPGSWTIHVPWDATLPEGRTALALIANNGEHDSNPAVVNVFRKHQEIPPNGTGPKGYAYTSPTANRRPVLLDLQDVVVKPGKIVRLPLRARDPEGQPVRFHKRAGELGVIDGDLFTFKVPRKGPGRYAVTILASDGSAGNSYTAKRVEFAVKPPVHAHIDADAFVGPAPFTLEVSSKGSIAPSGKMELGWEFYAPTPKRKPAEWKALAHDKTATHTFAKPGLYEVALTVRSGKETDRETVQVWVTKGAAPEPPGGVVVEGNGVRIADGDEAPSLFDHTNFDSVRAGVAVTRTFTLFNRGSRDLACSPKTVSIAGEHAAEFRVARPLRKKIAAGGAGTFAIEFRSRGPGPRSATVTIHVGATPIRFQVGGTTGAD